jgi:hypothetical protein
MTKPFQHERRIQGLAYAALGAAAILAVVGVLQGGSRLFGTPIPVTLLYGLVGAGAILGAVAIVRRSWLLALGSGALLTLGALPAGALAPGLAGYAVGLAYGAALLVFGELVHMMTRYEIAHRAVETDGLPEDHLNRVTDEALATLAGRAGYALVLAALAVALAFTLSLIGPAQWRAALETTSPLGVALTGATLLGLGSILILFRGARLPGRAAPSNQETPPDAVE